MSQHRYCKQCSKSFDLLNGEQQFFERLGLPFPSHCPDCRHQRRLCYRNDRTFYRRKCDKTEKEFISIYAPEKPYTVYHPDAWYGDSWDPMDYGRPFDFSRPFFEQFAELQRVVPRLGIDIVNCENSYFCNYCGDDKNCYLDIAGEANEDCYFNLFTKYSKNCVDCTFAYHSTLCYETIQSYNAYHLQYSMYCDDSADSLFCHDLKGSKHCLFSGNLRQKQYHIFNRPYSKEEFEKIARQMNLGSYRKREEYLQKWLEWRTKHIIYRDAYLLNCENSTGDNLKNCKNTLVSFNATNCEDSRYVYDVLDAKDCQDLNYSLYKPELSYELISTLHMTNSAFCMACHYCHETFYSELCNHSSDIFGCIGLQHKKYCILNKQYTKKEYETVKRKIIEAMKRSGEFGEFSPAKYSPWTYNETVANEYFPLLKEDVLRQGFSWFEQKGQKPAVPQTVVTPDHIREVPDSILKETLVCVACGKNYRIITQELSFYRQEEIPISRKCPDCRHRDRIRLRSPRRLFERACSNCSKAIQSTIRADRPESVLCEACYLEKVY